MSLGIGSKIATTITTTSAPEKEDDFFYALKYATTEFLPDSTIQDNTTLEKYIFEPISPIKKFTPYIFKPLLSPVREVEELEEDYKYGNGQQGGNDNHGDAFVVIFLTHGLYPVDNTRSPVTSITRTTAPLVVPGNKFDGYETLTICGAAPPSQVNMGLGNIIANPYHGLVIDNIKRLAVLLTEKVSSVEETEEPILVKPASNPTPRYSSSSRAPAIPIRKKYKLPSPASASVSAPSSLPGIIKSVSRSVKSKLFSLVRGCVKMVMNFNVNYSVLDLSDHRYNRIQKQVIHAIVCMNRSGILKMNSDLFDTFSYSLYNGIRQHDYSYFCNLTRTCLVGSTPGTHSHNIRKYATEQKNIEQRFPSVRVLVREGVYQPSHVEKKYLYHPVKDMGSHFGARVYKFRMKTRKNKKGEISVIPKIDFFDIPVDEIFRGIAPGTDGYFTTTLSDVSSLISFKINQEYYEGQLVKKILSFLDLTCSSFFAAQSQIPKTSGRSWGISKSFGRVRPNMGGGNKTRRRNVINKRKERKERKERSNSKIRNRILSRRTRKNRKKLS
jgi:hypothetical protein